MPRPNTRVDVTVECNENRIAAASEDNAEIAAAYHLLSAGERDLERGQSEIARAQRILCKLHGKNVELCRKLRCDNAQLVAGAA
jgi:hypothetical protein